MHHFNDLLGFLEQLSENNHKAWFDEHRGEYERHREFWVTIVRRLIRDLATLDPAIGRLEPKDCIFRINRDIRFSADKSPYKTQFGAFMAPGGKQSGNAGYYIHLEPGGKSFIAGGIYMPPGPVLKNIRSYIEEHGGELKSLLSNREFRKYFTGMDPEQKLKRPPKGIEPDHPHLDLLLYKSFTISHPFQPEKLADEGQVTDCIIKVFRAMEPFIRFMNTAVEPQ